MIPSIDDFEKIEAQDLVKAFKSPEGWIAFLLSSASIDEVKKAREEVALSPAVLMEDPVDSEAIKALEAVISGAGKGDDFSEAYPQIAKLINNQEARAELVTQLLTSHDFDRALRFTKLRERIEKMLETKLTGMQVIPPDVAFALLAYIGKEGDKLQSRIAAGTPEVKDIATLLAKVNYAIGQREDGEIRQIMASTRPQGREIVRRLAARISKVARAAKEGPPTEIADD